MGGKIRQWRDEFLLHNRLKLISTTEKSKIISFINSIKPLQTEHDLIRLGGDSDGGYLIPNDLDGISGCFSPGVGYSASFEYDMASFGVNCFIADYSVDALPISNQLFHFEKKFIGLKNDFMYMTLDDWVMRNTDDNQELILQMDIEGAEYESILFTSDNTLKKFRIICIEFHNLHLICEKSGFDLIHTTFQKLLKYFDVVHLHPNNNVGFVKYEGVIIPEVIEFTFIRKDRVKHRTSVLQLPHPLDRKNNPDSPDFVIPKYWY